MQLFCCCNISLYCFAAGVAFCRSGQQGSTRIHGRRRNSESCPSMNATSSSKGQRILFKFSSASSKIARNSSILFIYEFIRPFHLKISKFSALRKKGSPDSPQPTRIIFLPGGIRLESFPPFIHELRPVSAALHSAQCACFAVRVNEYAFGSHHVTQSDALHQ